MGVKVTRRDRLTSLIGPQRRSVQSSADLERRKQLRLRLVSLSSQMSNVRTPKKRKTVAAAADAAEVVHTLEDSQALLATAGVRPELWATKTALLRYRIQKCSGSPPKEQQVSALRHTRSSSLPSQQCCVAGL